MAAGDQQDFLSRLSALQPAGWYPPAIPRDGTNPDLDAVQSAAASAFVQIWTFQQYARLQTRLATATEANLDIWARDYLGVSFTRNLGETDDVFRARIKRNLLLPANTRAAIIANIEALTGTTPSILEPGYAPDLGCWSAPTVCGWGNGFRWGTPKKPYEFWITVPASKNQGVPNIGGWGAQTAGGWGAGSFAWVDSSQVSGTVTDAEIVSVIKASIPAGIQANVVIKHS